MADEWRLVVYIAVGIVLSLGVIIILINARDSAMHVMKERDVEARNSAVIARASDLKSGELVHVDDVMNYVYNILEIYGEATLYQYVPGSSISGVSTATATEEELLRVLSLNSTVPENRYYSFYFNNREVAVGMYLYDYDDGSSSYKDISASHPYRDRYVYTYNGTVPMPGSGGVNFPDYADSDEYEAMYGFHYCSPMCTHDFTRG